MKISLAQDNPGGNVKLYDVLANDKLPSKYEFSRKLK